MKDIIWAIPDSSSSGHFVMLPELDQVADDTALPIQQQLRTHQTAVPNPKSSRRSFTKCLSTVSLGIGRKNCRPYFVGILGERYGWVPREISEDLIQAQPWLREHVQQGKSVTELEILHGVLNDPQMATHAFFYFRDPVSPPARMGAIFTKSPGTRDPPHIGRRRRTRRRCPGSSPTTSEASLPLIPPPSVASRHTGGSRVSGGEGGYHVPAATTRGARTQRS